MQTPTIDKTALSYWFPKLEAAGLPVPRTKIIEMPIAAQEAVWAAFDGKDSGGEAIIAFYREIDAAAREFGYPVFLRTDHTSGKHGWERTCFLPSADDIPSHVFAIAEFSEICDMIGLPWSTWAVREMLPTIPFGTCPAYRCMPICREFRFFIDDGAVRCAHPYWPAHALEHGGADMAALDYDALCRMDNGDALFDLAMRAGRAVPGSWSVDILETRRGWMVTDMAEAHKSWHWPGCATASKGKP